MVTFDFFEPIKRFFGKGTWTIEGRESFKRSPDQKNFWFYFNEYYFLLVVPLNLFMIFVVMFFGYEVPKIFETILYLICLAFLGILFLFGTYLKKFNLSEAHIRDWGWLIFKSVRVESNQVFGSIPKYEIADLISEIRKADGIRCNYVYKSGFLYVDSEQNLLYLKLKYFREGKKKQCI